MSDAPGLYVHVPFCETKCPYCGFYSETAVRDEDGLLRAMAAEARLYASRFGEFDTVYFGGGTPSVVSDDGLELALELLRRELSIAQGAQVTIELNPGDVDRSRAERWLALGIDRASVGVQSFDDGALSFLGRRHDAKQAWDALGHLRDAGFASIGVDLIWGIPGQDDQSCLDSLERALCFDPEHLSCYELTVEPHTRLAQRVALGEVVLSDSETMADLGMAFWARLAEAGYQHYEVSNFAKSREHWSRHNTKYWRHVPYLGLGPSAHSFDGSVRWANVRSVAEYQNVVVQGRRPTTSEEVLTQQHKHVERVALGIRTLYGVDINDVSGGWVRSMVGQGCVRIDGDRVVPTESGMMMADALARSLLEA